mgnify:FL=1|jgi:hypothetical protein
MKIFLLNILFVSKIQVIFVSIKRTSKKHSLFLMSSFSAFYERITNITVFLLLFSVMVGSSKTRWMLTKLLKITALHKLIGSASVLRCP